MTDDGDMHHHTENEPSRLTENGLIARAKTRLNQTGVAVVISYAVNFRGEGLLAHVVVSKYVDHLPLRRLEGVFARQGIDLPRSTLCGWVADVPTAVTLRSAQMSWLVGVSTSALGVLILAAPGTSQ